MDSSPLHLYNLPPELPAAPAQSPLAIRHYESGCWTVVEVQGDLDLQGIPLLHEHLAETLTSPSTSLASPSWTPAFSASSWRVGRL